MNAALTSLLTLILTSFITPIVSIIVAIPFYIFWNWFNIRKFFYFLPDVFLRIGFWETVGLFVVVSFIHMIFVPKFATVTQTNKN